MEISESHKAFSFFMYFVAKLSSAAFFAIYLAFGIYLYLSHDNKLGFYIIVPLMCMITSYGLRAIIRKPRPYDTLKYELPHGLKHKAQYSMPSNHTASALIIACACIYVAPNFGGLVLALAFLTGISRVFMGIHYFSDVLVGWVLGLGFGILGFVVLPFI